MLCPSCNKPVPDGAEYALKMSSNVGGLVTGAVGYKQQSGA